MKYREGDFLETVEGLIFGVKGLMHPEEGFIAFLRYIPSEDGNREKNGEYYRKIYDLKDRFDYIRNNFPKYLFYSGKLNRMIQLVPIKDIKRVYKPKDRFDEFMRNESELSQAERSALNLSRKIIDESGIEKGKIGVTGSLLVGLETKDSDIDIVVYGEEEGRKVYSALERLRSTDKDLLPYDSENALKIAKFRWGDTDLSIEKLAEIERDKVLHGLFEGKDFFIRLVRDAEDPIQNYEDFSCTEFGSIEIYATITEDKDSIFTPVSYSVTDCQVQDLRDCNVEEIVSYRGRFTEQVSKGDRVKARGKLEKVSNGRKDYWRLILEDSEDYLVPVEIV